MASIAQLNVRLGLLYEGFDRSLQQVENKLRRSGQRMSQLGNDLTLAISAPLLALGGAAIKQAANLESLENALASQMGSAEAARKELELLRKEALKPGLGFEQAIRGSVQLQAVGFSAEFARRTLASFGNALATAGKGKQELDGVALALTQISAKGKVSAEEINQIAERLPQIRTAMKAAFGTADTEVLQKMKISSQQFIEGIVKELEKIPPASNSLKNNIENAGDAINQFLASIGMEINKTFNLSEKSQQLSEFLRGAAASFAGLDDSTKRTIIQFGLFALAAGPVVKVLGVMSSTGAAVAGVFRTLGGTISGAIGSVLGLADSVNRLKLAFGIIGIVIAATTAIYLLSQQFDAATFAQQQFADAQKAVHRETATEIGALERNIGVLKDVTSTNADRKAAIDALLKQYPDYLKGINLETQSVEQLTKIQRDLTTEIQRSVAERKKADALNGIYEKRAEILLRINALKKGADVTAGEATLIDTGDMIREGGIANAVIKELEKQVVSLKDNADSTGRQFDETFGLVGRAARRASPAVKEVEKVVEDTTVKFVSQKSAVDNLADSYKELDKATRVMTRKEQTADLKGFKGSVSPGIGAGGALPSVLASIENPFAGIAESVMIATTAMQQNLTVMGQAAVMYQMVREGTDGLTQSMTAMASEYIKQGQVLEAGALEIGAAIADAANKGASSLGDYAKAALGAGAKVIRVWIQMAVTRAALSALDKIPFPFNIAAAAAAGGIAAGLFNSLIKKVGIPALAQGGVATGPTLAMVGEYAGARNNPEIIAPESKIRNLFRGEMSRMGGGMGGALSVRVTGDDLLFILEKAQRKAGRKR